MSSSVPEPADQTMKSAVPAERSFASGRYVVRRPLPEGGQKTVYVVHDAALDRDCVLALIRPDLLEADDLERFRREARAMARLDHPNIVAVYEVSEEDGRPFFVCQYITGGDLRSALREAGGPLPVDRALTITEDVCRALAHAHEHGIVHRDVKPANVWLTSDGTAKLGDFGLATAVDRSRLTLAGTFVGTAAYMAPEQAMGQPADARSDLYALGCVLYELLTGRPPFLGGDALAVIAQHANTAPVAPSWHNPDVPPSIEALVVRLLAKSPDDRPASAQEVASELRRILERSTVEPPQMERHAHTDLRGLTRGIFVGRREEMDGLKDALEDALSGKGSLAMLVGEPGIGKTRLAEEFCVYSRLRGAQVLTGRGYDGESSLPYTPFIEALREYTRSRADDELRAELGPGAPEIATLVSEIRRRFPDIEEAPKLDGEAERLRLFESMTQFLHNAATANPVVLFLDDLHWADKPSLLLLQHLSQRTNRDRLLLLGAYRDVDLDRAHPLADALGVLRRLPNYRRVLLRGLPEETITDLLSAIDPSEEGAPARLALSAALYQETEGNPFFIREVLAHLIETGKIVHENGRWVGRVTSISELGIPEGVREVIGRRLSRLSDGCNRVLTRASTMTGGFSWEALKAINADVPEGQLLDLLEQALAAQLIMERKGEGAGAYDFTHALIRQTLYDALSTPRRVLLHRQIGEALERLYADNVESHLAELAHHFYQAVPGGDAEKAIDYSIRAGRRAMEMVAWEEAAQYFERAVESMSEGTEDAERHCRVLLDLGEVLIYAGQASDAVGAYRRAAAVARDASLPELLGEAASGLEEAGYFVLGDPDLPRQRLEIIDEALNLIDKRDSAIRARLLAQRTRPALALGGAGDALRTGGFGSLSGERNEEVVVNARDAVAMAERVGDPAVTAQALNYLIQALQGPATDAERRALAETQIQQATLAGNVRLLVAGYDLLFIPALAQGDMVAAREAHERGLRLGEATKIGWAVWSSLARRATLLLADGRLSESEAAAFEALSVGQAVNSATATQAFGGQLFVVRWCQGRLAEIAGMFKAIAEQSPNVDIYQAAVALIYAETGQLDDAQRVIDGLVARGLEAIPQDTFWKMTILGLADASVRLHTQDACAAFYDVAMRHPAGNVSAGNSVSQGAFARSLGQLAMVLERFDQAQHHFEDALNLNETMGHRPALAFTRLNYGDMLLRRNGSGDRERAIHLLQQAHGFAKESGMAVVERDSERLLASLG